MTARLASRISAVKPSATLVVSALADTLKAQGKDIINLSVGEPDFDTPFPIKQAAKEAIDNNFTHYTAVDGIPELKAAIQAKFIRDNALHYSPEQIIVSSGAKQAIYNALQVLINEDDEVIIPAPYWVSYPEMVVLAGGNPVIVAASMEHQFKITAQQLAAAITDKTRLFIINSPSNPTGMLYSREELLELANVLLNYPQVTILSDDIYEHILWSEQKFSNLATVCPALAERCLVINGASKVYAMTGWRIGYAAGPAAIIKAMKMIQSQSTSNPCSIAQYAALAALQGDHDFLTDWCATYKRRHDLGVAMLSRIPGVKCLPSDGTFYLFPHVAEAIKNLGLKKDTEFATYLLEHAGVATVPGTPFGAPGYIRISFALGDAIFKTALERIQRCLAEGTKYNS